ncbi:hypothetical protein IQ22_00949 [Pseudomonas duriflava]|uniref:Uncharacterized protein n=1 Tax=Pseudomonas duriflava TaxID=459528 RepID=A0A562QJY5_9PSED|nr:hypothetical protein IQ22_00949 [Pseudomonas duriflava]
MPGLQMQQIPLLDQVCIDYLQLTYGRSKVRQILNSGLMQQDVNFRRRKAWRIHNVMNLQIQTNKGKMLSLLPAREFFIEKYDPVVR